MKALLIITMLGDYGCYPVPPAIQPMESMQKCSEAAMQVEMRLSRAPGQPFTADGRMAPRELRAECIQVP